MRDIFTKRGIDKNIIIFNYYGASESAIDSYAEFSVFVVSWVHSPLARSIDGSRFGLGGSVVGRKEIREALGRIEIEEDGAMRMSRL
jgi:hypothetical protein